MTFIETVSLSLGTGVLVAVILSCLQGEKLPSLNRDENGKLNPMLSWWIFLSLVHVGIVYGWSYFLYYLGIIKLHEEFDQYWITVAFFFGYWVIFESFYWTCHRLQHLIPCFGRLTGHRGEISEKFHHGMKPPYGPDYLTAFSAHPLDDLVVQVSAQIPWVFSYIFGLITNQYLVVSHLTYGIILSWLVFIGMRAHTRYSFGGKNHCKHHDNPSKGPYSFSGIPEALFEVVSCRENE